MPHARCGCYRCQSSCECSYYNLRYDLPKTFVTHFFFLFVTQISLISLIFFNKNNKYPS